MSACQHLQAQQPRLFVPRPTATYLAVRNTTPTNLRL
jgi:hypothetical protein